MTRKLYPMKKVKVNLNPVTKKKYQIILLQQVLPMKKMKVNPNPMTKKKYQIVLLQQLLQA